MLLFDDLVTLAVWAADGDERHGPFLPNRGYEDEAQCDSNLSPSPLLKHYPASVLTDHLVGPLENGGGNGDAEGLGGLEVEDQLELSGLPHA